MVLETDRSGLRGDQEVEKGSGCRSTLEVKYLKFAFKKDDSGSPLTRGSESRHGLSCLCGHGWYPEPRAKGKSWLLSESI